MFCITCHFVRSAIAGDVNKVYTYLLTYLVRHTDALWGGKFSFFKLLRGTKPDELGVLKGFGGNK